MLGVFCRIKTRKESNQELNLKLNLKWRRPVRNPLAKKGRRNSAITPCYYDNVISWIIWHSNLQPPFDSATTSFVTII
jgi:hypothetical protein